MTTPTPANLNPPAPTLPSSPNGTSPADEHDALEHLDDYIEPAEFQRRARPTGPLTWALLALVFAAGIFSLGAKLGEDNANNSTATTGSTSLSSLANAFRSGGGAASFFAGRTGTGGGTGSGSSGAAGGATIGSVQLVDGTNVYIDTTSGGVDKITTTPASKINVTTPGSLADLKPGTFISVQGTPGANSVIAATTINQVATGGFGRSASGAASGTGSTTATTAGG